MTRWSLRTWCRHCQQTFYAASPVSDDARPAHERTAQWFKATHDAGWPNDCRKPQHDVVIDWDVYSPTAGVRS